MAGDLICYRIDLFKYSNLTRVINENLIEFDNFIFIYFLILHHIV